MFMVLSIKESSESDAKGPRKPWQHVSQHLSQHNWSVCWKTCWRGLLQAPTCWGRKNFRFLINVGQHC